MKTVLALIVACSIALIASCSKTPASASSAPVLVQQNISFSLKNELAADVSLAVANLQYSWERRSPYVVFHAKSPSQLEAPLYEPTIKATNVQNSVIGIIIEEVDSYGEEVAMIRFTVAESNAMRQGHDVLLHLTESGITIEHNGNSRTINWITPPSDWKSAPPAAP